MIIRNFKKEDFPFVLEMVRNLARHHHQLDPFYRTPEEMKDLKENIRGWLKERKGKVLIVEIDNKIVGYIRGSFKKIPYYARENELIATVDDIFIKKEYRLQTIGKNLFDELLKWFKSKKATALMLNVDVRNESAIKFWEKMGFEKFVLRMKKEI